MEAWLIIVIIFLGLFISYLLFTEQGRDLLMNMFGFVFQTTWGLIKGIIIVGVGLVLAVIIMRFFNVL